MSAIIDPTLDLEDEIDRLRKERNAVILAHYYQEPEIQDLADFIGDSLQLSQAAKGTDADVILFCGVHFMAETAKILNPSKTVLVPDLAAGCSLADSCPADELSAWKDANPDHLVVSYINCSAATKALSDIICTSSNAQKVVDSLPADRPILFAPDRNLGAWLVRQTGREMDLWQGVCIVHDTFSERELISLKTKRPEAEVIAHPECDPSLLGYADPWAPPRRCSATPRRVIRTPSSWPQSPDHSPDAGRLAGQRIYPAAGPRRVVRLQRVPLHAPEHTGEDLPGAPRHEARVRA